MVCKKCGRMTDTESDICKGCGAQLGRPKGYISDGLRASLGNVLPIGKGRLKVWVAALIPIVLAALLVSGMYAAPWIQSCISSRREASQEPVYEEPDLFMLSAVSGDIVTIDKPMFCVSESDILPPISASDVVTSYSDCVMLENTAYSDGTWNREFLVYDEISVRMMRFADSGIEAVDRVRQLYPDVVNIEYFSESPSISGQNTMRIFIPASEDGGDVVDALIFSTDANDYIVTIEAPEDVYSDNEVNINEWIRRMKLVDAFTGEEYTPEVSVSDADISPSDTDASGDYEDSEYDEYYLGDYSID